MAQNAGWQRYKERLGERVLNLRGRLVSRRTRGITWVHRVVASGRSRGHKLWRRILTIPNDVWNGMRQAISWIPLQAWVIVAIIVFVGVLWLIPKCQVSGIHPKDNAKRLELEDKVRGTLAQLLAGVGIAVGLYFTWRRVTAAERTVQVAAEGQITERFTRAIDQLGATDDQGRKRLELRLGGIYALERIGRDSEKDHWPIMEVLTAYIREHAPWKEVTQTQQEQSSNAESHPSEDTSQEPTSPSRLKPDIDIQAILTIIGRRTRWYEKGEDERLDLRGTDIRAASLRYAHLEGALLSDAHLEEALLSDAHLEEALLIRAHLEKVLLIRAHLEKANLSGAHLEEAELIGAQLEGAELSGAHLEGANLVHAYLKRANLSDAHLEGANLVYAHLKRAKLVLAHLEGADLSDAHLEGALLIRAHLEGADLSDAHLEGALLSVPT